MPERQPAGNGRLRPQLSASATASADESASQPLLSAAALACVIGTLAFAVYTRTLLPGVDLGDTGGFQAAVLWPETSARRGYPLYYFLATPFVAAFTPEAPAQGLNLFSALTGGVAVGLLTFLAAAVTRSLLAGAVAGAMLAFGYTFWTQSVIAEVYALHLALMGACMTALYACSRRPGATRLALFFAIYALSFGNHLGMILLLLPFAVFLLRIQSARELLRLRVIAMAAALAIAGALQYAPNLIWALTSIDAPQDWRERVAAFWIDTTKADWRQTMVLGVSPSEAWDRVAMWWWDSRQQFGVIGLSAAAIGAIRLWRISPPWALLAWLTYGVSTAFALTYNVGDPHVFFLPGHFITAFAVAAAVVPPIPRHRHLSGIRSQTSFAPPVLYASAAALLIGYAGWRAWDTYPAADRHLDRRAEALVARVATGINDGNAVLLSRMNWEAENALLYSARYERDDLAWTRLAAVLPHLPYLVRDNLAIDRDIVLTADAAADVVATYGTLFPIVRDDAFSHPSLLETASQIPEGLPYILTRLSPPPGERLDEEEFGSVLKVLTGEAPLDSAPGRYQVWAGRTGAPPVFHRAADRPFRERFSILGDEFTVRMDSWLPFDSFRRGGFGHVLRGRERIHFVERGVSFVWFRPDGSPSAMYATGLYAPKPRFRIPAGTPQLVRLGRADSGERRASQTKRPNLSSYLNRMAEVRMLSSD